MKQASEIFKLRLFRPSDAPSLARHANNRNVSRNLRDAFPFPYTLESAKQFIEKLSTESERALVLCIDVAGEAVGAVGAHGLADVYLRTAEVGYWLAELHWGRGIAAVAVHALGQQAFARWNVRSARVLEKAGYQRGRPSSEHLQGRAVAFAALRSFEMSSARKVAGRLDRGSQGRKAGRE